MRSCPHHLGQARGELQRWVQGPPKTAPQAFMAEHHGSPARQVGNGVLREAMARWGEKGAALRTTNRSPKPVGEQQLDRPREIGRSPAPRPLDVGPIPPRAMRSRLLWDGAIHRQGSAGGCVQLGEHRLGHSCSSSGRRDARRLWTACVPLTSA